jgi:hypothetical protein
MAALSRQLHCLTAPWLLAMALAGCADDGPVSAAGSAAEAAATEGELLLAQPPAGWVETAALQTPNLRMAEYGPPVEPDGVVERVTLEAQPGTPLPDPIEFVLAVARDLGARCRRLEDVNVSSGLENGYPTSVRLIICREFRDTPQGQVVMAKAIQGNEQFYVITRRRLTAPVAADTPPLTAQEMAEWAAYLKGVGVCDTRRPEHPCPASALPQ